MGFLLLAIVGLGVVAWAKAGKAGGGAPAGGPPVVDPATTNPLLAGPRLQTINGIVALTAPWLDVSILRLARYAPGPVTPLTQGPKMLGALRFADDFKTAGPGGVPLTAEQLRQRSVLLWMHDENAKGNAIIVQTTIVTGPFTEAGDNTTKANPTLPRTILIEAVSPLTLPQVAAPGGNFAVVSAVPGTL